MRPHLAVATLVLLAGCSNAEPVDAEASSNADFAVVYNGAELEVGATYRYAMFIHCGMEWLTDFNDTVWLTDDPIYDGNGRYSEDLRQYFRNPSEQISPELWTHITLVDSSEIRLTLPDGSQETIYRPTDRDWPGCA